MNYEKTLIIIKPDGVQRRLIGRVLQRFEDAGLKLHAAKFTVASREQSKRHYHEHVERHFYPVLEDYITAGPVLVFVLGGLNAIKRVRTMVGATAPAEALPGTIRGDLAHQVLDIPPEGQRQRTLYNIIHASSSPEDAETEIGVWFAPEDVLEYDIADDHFHGL